MSNQVYNTRSIPCHYCHKSNAVARTSEIDSGKEIITQVKWICSLCNNLVKAAEMGRKPKS